MEVHDFGRRKRFDQAFRLYQRLLAEPSFRPKDQDSDVCGFTAALADIDRRTSSRRSPKAFREALVGLGLVICSESGVDWVYPAAS